MEIDKEQLKENAENLKQSGAEVGKMLAWMARTFFADKKKAMPDLCEGLISQGKWGRIYASVMIKKYISTDNMEVLPFLIEALGDSEKQVVVNAAATIAAFGNNAGFAVLALKNCAEAAMEEECRAAAEAALAATGSEISSGFAAAVQHLKNPNPRIRRYSAELIGTLGVAARNAVPYLKEAAQDEDASVRAGAIKALGNMGKYAAPAASVVVERITIDDDIEVKQEAAMALINMGPEVPGVKESLVEIASGSNKDLSELVLGNIGKFGEDALPVLIKALREGTPAQKRKACQSLGDMGAAGKEALKYLSDALMSDDALLRGLAKNSMHKIKSQTGII
jgi:HEAT repeat protein